MSNKLGQEPAFPLVNDSQNDQRNFVEYGMTKRFYAACAAMQGLCALPNKGTFESLVEQAFKYADELLKQENE